MTNAVSTCQNNYDNIILVALGGPSSSGKTTSAKALHSLFANSILIHLDDFYLPDDQIPVDPVKKEQNWDCPEAIDFDKFTEYIKDLKLGISTHVKQESLEPESTLQLTRDEIVQFQKRIKKKGSLNNTLIVFIDGFMLFHDLNLVKLFDIKLFYHASFDTLKERREARKGYTTIGGFWVDPPDYFCSLVWPEYVKSHKYLFENENVESELNSFAKNELGISDMKNETGLSLYELIDWSLNRVLERL